MKKENIKLIITDIDGTLVDDNSVIPHNFIEMINHLAAEEIIFVAASGRGVISIKEKLKHSAKNLYIISNNGAIIMQDDNIIDINNFDQRDFEIIVREFQKIKDVTICATTPTRSYVQLLNDGSIDHLYEYYPKFEIVEDLALVDDKFVSVNMFSESKTTENYNSDIIQELGLKYDIVQAGAQWIDALPKNNNKGVALQRLVEILDIDINHTIAFGDFNNDIQMIEVAKKGYAMLDATDLVKAAADEIIGSNNDNSVINKIYELLEIA